MPLPPDLILKLNNLKPAASTVRTPTPGGIVVKRGADILADTDYPQDWDSFIGQDDAKNLLTTHISSCSVRGATLDHILLASGLHGIGKTALAHLIAYEAGVGLACVSGPVTLEEAERALLSMQDGDILFWDEIHNAVVGGKAKIEWLLPYMTDRKLMTSRGAIDVPNVTIVAATTDTGRLPQTVLSRFLVRPRLVPYTPAQAEEIALTMAKRIDAPSGGMEFHELLANEIPHPLKRIAQASNWNPRNIKTALAMVRDVYTSGSAPTPPWEDDIVLLKQSAAQDPVGQGIDWAGFSYDGLEREACDILQVLLLAQGHTLSIDTIAAQLNEPGPLRHAEQTLLQHGLITITGRGRKLTDSGLQRALLLATGVDQDLTLYDETWYRNN